MKQPPIPFVTGASYSYAPRFVVCDDFHDNPDDVRRWVLAQKFHEPRGITGWRTSKPIVPHGTRTKLQRAWGRAIRHWSHSDNGVAYMAFARGERREHPRVHADAPVDYVTVVIYLGPRDLPADCGTSLFRHRRTGLIGVPDRATLRRLGHTVDSLCDTLCDAGAQRAADWEEVDRIGYRFNRAVLYPAGLFHSATRHAGGDLERGRIYQGFHFGV